MNKNKMKPVQKPVVQNK